MASEQSEQSGQCVVVVDGEQYDLTGFLSKHPGGPSALLFSHARDVSIAVHTVHKDPARTVLPILKKYKVEKPKPIEEVVKSKMGIPHFLLPEGYNAATDGPQYNFDNNDDSLLLNKVRKFILQRDVQKRIRELDTYFDYVVMTLMAVYAILLPAWLSGRVPWYIAVPLFVLLRTGLASGGHFYIHRGANCLGDFLFDINYVGTAFTGQDGHVLLHHVYTQKEADVKRGFFGGMMGVPRILRIPVHTLHKLGHTTTGLLVRGYEFETDGDNSGNQGVSMKLRQMGYTSCNWRFWAVQALLRIELVLALYYGVFWAWFAQFSMSLWLNTLLVVSSHDFTAALEPDTKDWARFQLLNAHDFHVTGNPWLDCFLGAGLAQHRAHHILPYQRSGWANHYSGQFISQAAKDAGLPWFPSKSLLMEIFPLVIKRQLLVPVCDPVTRKQVYSSLTAEHTSLKALWYSVKYIVLGFTGIGSL